MEEKKLTDEEIVKALECLTMNGESNCCGCKFYTGNGFEECIKNVAINSISLIHRLQGEKAEHEEFTQKAKAEIERLTEENRSLIGRNAGLCCSNNRLKERISKYKMQVDELKKENAKVISFNDALYREKPQTVKDTAKEIWNDITSYYFSLRVIGNTTVELDKLAEFWHKRGVEVE